MRRWLLPARLAYGIRSDSGYRRNFRLLGGRLPIQDLETRRHDPIREITRRFRYAVFFSSTDANSPAQLIKWFRYGFLPREETLVLGKLYYGVSAGHIRDFEKAGLSYLLFRAATQLDVSPLRAVFYPYNTLANPILVRTLGPEHVFIGHGESDKQASINPMIRIYDRIFVSGDTAVERLLRARIVNPYDLTSGRVVKIGMPYLNLGEPARERTHVLYAPTWEGMEGQQYSSVRDGFGERIIAALLDRTPHKVVFRPHPSTGVRDTRYVGWVRAIAERFAGAPRFEIHVDESQGAPLDDVLRTSGASVVHCNLDVSTAAALWVVADRSSIVSAAIYHRCPFLLTDCRVSEQLASAESLGRFAEGYVLDDARMADEIASLMNDDARYRTAMSNVEHVRNACVGREEFLHGVETHDMLGKIMANWQTAKPDESQIRRVVG